MMVRVYLTDTAHFAEFNAIYDELLRGAGSTSPRPPAPRSTSGCPPVSSSRSTPSPCSIEGFLPNRSPVCSILSCMTQCAEREAGRGAVVRAGGGAAPAARRKGALVLALFALLWAAAGASGLRVPGPCGAAAGTAVLAAVTAAAALAVRSGGAAAARPRRLPDGWYHRACRIAVSLALTAGAAAAGLCLIGAAELAPPTVCLVVALHLHPLARVLDQPQYWWTGVALALVAAAGYVVCAAGAAGGAVRAVVGFGAAVVLLVASLHVSLRG